MPKPPILFLSQCLPYPPHSGVTNRTFNIARQLAHSFDLEMLAFSRRNHQVDAAARAQAILALQAELGGTVQAVPIRSESAVLSRALAHGRSVVSRRPYTWYEYDSPAFAALLRESLARRPPALVHMDSLDLVRWLPLLEGLPVAVTHHSVESDLLRLRAQHHPNPLVARYLGHQADLLARVEREWAPRAAVNVMMSAVDAERLRALAPAVRTTVAPNGVDTEALVPAEPPAIDPHRLVFLGPTYMFPNRDGVEFFLAEIWPRIRGALPAVTLALIGKNAPADRARFAGVPGVTPYGYVPDIRPAFAAAACSIVPIRVGGGTRLKILDAWALGKAVVSTTVGCEGLVARHGENILIADTPADFADAVIRVLRDPALRRRLEEQGRHTAEAYYSWTKVGHDLRNDYHHLIEGAR